MAVLAISQQLGSKGLDLGRLVADSLNYPFVGPNDLVNEAAQEYKVTPEQLHVIDEHKPHFWERFTTDATRLYSFLRAVLLRRAASGNLVVVGRTVPLMLPQGLPQALRVRTVSPLGDRVRQVMVEESMDEPGAQRRISHYDQEVAARVRSLIGVEVDEPTLYDLVINTAHKPLQVVSDRLTLWTRAVDQVTDQRARTALSDASLVALVRAGLLAHPKIGHAEIDVTCIGGRIRLRSIALVPPWDSLAITVVREIPGVTEVALDLDQPPLPVSNV